MLTAKPILKKNSFAFWLGIILLCHIIFLLLHFSKISMHYTLQDPPEAPMKVRLLDHVPANRQIVRSEDSELKEKRPDAFLSDKDRSFDRQTIARKVDVFKEGGKGNASFDARGTQGKISKVHGGSQGKKTGQTAKGLKGLKLSDLGSAHGMKDDPFQAAAKEYSMAKKGQKTGSHASRGISSTNDYVENVPLGDLTQLNTVEYKYFGYYLRIRQKLEQFWGRSIQEKAEELMKSGRRIASGEEMLTALQVVMDDKGKIIDINIKGSSGIREIDDAAINSFNDAGPFPHPPQDLIVDGRVVIEWGFVVNT